MNLLQLETNSHNKTILLLPSLLEAQAQANPNATAVIFNDNWLTFAELNGRANQLACLLQKQGVGVETLVAVCLERSVEMVVALLIVLKVGAAYVPIDPSYPVVRIEWMLADAETAVYLTTSHLAQKLPYLP